MKKFTRAFQNRTLTALTLLLISTSAFSQTYQTINAYGYKWQRGVFQYNLGIPSDTLTPHASQLLVPHVASKGDSLYTWSVAQQRWILTGGTGSFIQNQYTSAQTANAWFDTLKLSRLNITGRITGSMTHQSWIHMPFRTNTGSANVGIHITNLPLWDTRLKQDGGSSAVTEGLDPAPSVTVDRNQMPASPLNIYRYLYENDGDTNRIDYSPMIYLQHRYHFDPAGHVFDSGVKDFFFHYPGIYSSSQHMTQGRNIRAIVGSTGNNGANFTGNLRFFDSTGTITLAPGGDSTYAFRPVPSSNFFSDIDLNHAGLSSEKKVLKGYVGLAGFFANWKQHQGSQGLPVKDAGSFTERITDFYSGGGTLWQYWKIIPAWTKDSILNYSQVKYSIGFYAAEKYNRWNEVANGYGIVQEGTEDINQLSGKTFIGVNNRMYNQNYPVLTKAIADTTSARLIVEGKAYIDSVQVDNMRGTGTRPVSVDASGNLTAPTQAVQTLTDGATVTWNMNAGVNATVTLGGNRTLAITNAVAGQYGTLKVVQDGTGSRTITLPAGSKVIGGGAGAVTLTTTAAAVDILTFFYDGNFLYWNIGLNYN